MEIRPQLELRTQLSADFNTSSNDLPKHRKIYNDDFSYVRGYNTGEIGGTLHVGNSFGLKSLYTSKVEIAKQQLISEKNFSIGMHISGALAKNGNAERYFNSTGAFLAWDFGFGNIDLSLNATNNHTTPVIQFSIVNRY
jgi:outer membrane translocation and assembly module TamA